MKKAITIIFVIVCATASAWGQEKGVDKQNERIRDIGNGHDPAINGSKTNEGVGRGINFGKDKTPAVPVVPNPYRFTGRRDTVMKAVEQLMSDRKLVLDEAASKPADGIIVSQPYTFIKGAVVSEAELSRYADLPNSNGRGWTRGRYTIVVEIQPVDALSSNVSINAKIEGRTDGASGAEWITLRSAGSLEQELLRALVDITGGSPSGPTP